MSNGETDLPISDFINKVKEAVAKKILYTIHAIDEMNAEDELISRDEVRISGDNNSICSFPG